MPSSYAHVVDRAEVGVVQPGGRPRLAQEALAHLRVVAGLEVRHLERLLALQFGVHDQVDGAHAAAAQLLLDAVAAEHLGQPMLRAG